MGYGVDVAAVVGVVSSRLRGLRIIKKSKGIMRGVRRVDEAVQPREVEKGGSVTGQGSTIHLLSSGHLSMEHDISEEAKFRGIQLLGRNIRSDSGRALEESLASSWVGSGEGIRVKPDKTMSSSMESVVAMYPVKRGWIVNEVGGARGGSAAVPGFHQKGVHLRYLVGKRV
jgi:hypothetical protein